MPTKPTISHTIIITFYPGQPGRMTAKVDGISGPVCANVSKWLNGLGEVRQDLKTSDFYQDGQEIQARRTVQA